jgi:hypothetical protein
MSRLRCHLEILGACIIAAARQAGFSAITLVRVGTSSASRGSHPPSARTASSIGPPRCQARPSDRGRLGRRVLCGSQCLGNRTESDLAQRPLAARRPCQQCREQRVHRQHHAHLCREPSRTRQIAVIHTPERLQSCVNSLHRGPALVNPLEFLVASGRAGNLRRCYSRGTRTVLPYALPACKPLTSGTPT